MAPDAEEGVYVVQFVTDPEEVFREAVRDLGGVIYSYLANHAYLVRMATDARQQVQGLPYVRAVVPFHPAYKSAEFDGAGAPPDEPTPYNILVFQGGAEVLQVVADRVVAVGGVVDALPVSGLLLRATLPVPPYPDP
jgi:hypothetical protein